MDGFPMQHPVQSYISFISKVQLLNVHCMNDMFLELFGTTVEFSCVEIIFFSAMDTTAVDVPGRKSGVTSALPHILNTLLAVSVLCATD